MTTPTTNESQEQLGPHHACTSKRNGSFRRALSIYSLRVSFGETSFFDFMLVLWNFERDPNMILSKSLPGYEITEDESKYQMAWPLTYPE